MFEAMKLKSKDVPNHLRGGYSGRKFRLEAKTEVIIPSDANLWSGGSRDSYTAIRLSDGASIQIGSREAPWSPHRSEKVVTLVPDIAIVRHSFFCGKDMGLSYFVHPDNVVKFIK
jgi:hypothetical protein